MEESENLGSCESENVYDNPAPNYLSIVVSYLLIPQIPKEFLEIKIVCVNTKKRVI